MTQSPDLWSERLSAYLDDELDVRDRAALEAHLQDCPACRTALSELRAVMARAASLPDSAPPAERLWPGIAAAIRNSPREGRARRTFSFTLPQLVAAGLALMVLSGGMVWLARLGGDRTDFPPVAAHDVPVATASGTEDASFDDVVAGLQHRLDARRAALDPQTVKILQDNLEAIDRAIDQCREALAGDPDNSYLKTYLSHARSRKLALLRRAAALTETRS
jgi:anti-sigma factor RsiW